MTIVNHLKLYGKDIVAQRLVEKVLKTPAIKFDVVIEEAKYLNI